MTTIKDKMYFNYNGKDSRDFGLVAVDLGGGMYEETFLPERKIHETRPERRVVPIFHGVTLEKRSFQLTLAFERGFNEDMLEGIVEWLFKDEYKPLYFEGGVDRIMFSMISGRSSLVHNGLKEGYFTVEVETNSPYRYSREKRLSIENRESMRVNNEGHKETYPVYKIEKIGSGDLELNMNGKSVLIVNLEAGETLLIDSQREIIETDILGAYRYNNIRAGELEDLYLKKGLSEMIVTGGASIELAYREVYKI